MNFDVTVARLLTVEKKVLLNAKCERVNNERPRINFSYEIVIRETSMISSKIYIVQFEIYILYILYISYIL